MMLAGGSLVLATQRVVSRPRLAARLGSGGDGAV